MNDLGRTGIGGVDEHDPRESNFHVARDDSEETLPRSTLKEL